MVPGTGDMTTAGVGRNFDVGGGNLNIGAALTSMTKDEKQELAKNLMASYTRNIGDATVGMNVNKPLDIPADVYQAALMGSMPIGQGRAMISAQGKRVNGQDYPVNQMIGYEHPVGPGQLSFNASQMKDFPESRQYQLQYRMPLGRADGGVAHMKKGGQYPYAQAHETARLNAIKMLGLHEHNTAQDRAKAMGINTDAYHGSKQDIRGGYQPGYDDNLAFVTPDSGLTSAIVSCP